MTFDELVTFTRASREVVDDQTAVKALVLYPEWAPGLVVHPGDRYKYKSPGENEYKLYKCKENGAHVTQADWTPDITPALWDVINVDHAGTYDDPIPYDPNMVVFEDLYYTYEEKTYLCLRDSGQPLYTTPDTLLGNYFELI